MRRGVENFVNICRASEAIDLDFRDILSKKDQLARIPLIGV